jgi:FKBP-type peptidyl-prolyl cis-trans isomerase 2
MKHRLLLETSLGQKDCGESAKIRIKKKFAFGRPGEVEALRFPPGYSTSDADVERRQKITTKAVIYELTLVDFVVR